VEAVRARVMKAYFMLAIVELKSSECFGREEVASLLGTVD
jgi:hypothetical protein